MSVAARALQAARHEAGLSQEQLAGRCHVSERTIRSLESGNAKRPHRDTLVAIANALGMSPERSEAFVASWRDRTRTINELFRDRLPEQALFEELQRQRTMIRERVISWRLSVGPDRRWGTLAARRTFEVVDDRVEHFVNVSSFPVGQTSGTLDPSECVLVEPVGSVDAPAAHGIGLVLAITAPIAARDVITIGYGLDYGPVDADPPAGFETQNAFAVFKPLTLMAQEVRFDPAAVPARAYLVRGDTVDGAMRTIEELAISPAGIVHVAVLPVPAGVHGIRWEWD